MPGLMVCARRRCTGRADTGFNNVFRNRLVCELTNRVAPLHEIMKGFGIRQCFFVREFGAVRKRNGFIGKVVF